MKAGYAGDDAVGLAQALDEARDGHDLAAVPLKEPLHVVEALADQEDVPPRAQDEPASPEMPDRKPMLSPVTAAANAITATSNTFSRPRPGIHGGGDQDRFARHRHPEVLQQDQARHRDVAIVV